MAYKPISCTAYDQFELWCMRHQALLLTVRTGEKVQGTAKNLTMRQADGEYLILETNQGEYEIRLDDIVEVDVS